jgi:hypothetical protein
MCRLLAFLHRVIMIVAGLCLGVCKEKDERE